MKVLEEATARGNVAKTCRHYGISREIFYQWRRRYQADDVAGLRDRPQGPHHCPRATPTEIVEKILYLRQHYHMGPWRIRMYLRRYHEIVIADQHVMASLAQMERELLIERTQAGLEAAKTAGRVGGRRPKMTASKLQAAQQLLDSGVPPKDVAANLGISVPTLYRWIPANPKEPLQRTNPL